MGQSPTWQDSTKPFRQFNSGVGGATFCSTSFLGIFSCITFVLVVQSASHVQLFVTPWTAALRYP